MPTGTDATWNSPRESDCVVRSSPVAWFLTRTLAPATGAPCSSETVPRRLAVDWARAGHAKTSKVRRHHVARSRDPLFIIDSSFIDAPPYPSPRRGRGSLLQSAPRYAKGARFAPVRQET